MLIKKLYMEAASKSCLSQLKKYLAISNQRNTAIKSAQAIFLHALQALNSSQQVHIQPFNQKYKPFLLSADFPFIS